MRKFKFKEGDLVIMTKEGRWHFNIIIPIGTIIKLVEDKGKLGFYVENDFCNMNFTKCEPAPFAETPLWKKLNP